LQPHEQKVLQILFLFDCLFLYLLFFKKWREKVLEVLSSFFLQNVFATYQQKVLQILFLFDCLFLCLLFFKRWRERVLQPMNKRFYRFYFYLIVYFYLFFFLRDGEKGFCHP